MKVYFLSLPDNNMLARVHVDEIGAAYAVYGDAVIRISPDGAQVETGSKRGSGPTGLGEETLLARGDDGSLYLFGSDGRARVVGPGGRTRFRSRASRKDDEESTSRRSYIKNDDEDEPAPTAEEKKLFEQKYEKQAN
jgi:hypothetical protein